MQAVMIHVPADSRTGLSRYRRPESPIYDVPVLAAIHGKRTPMLATGSPRVMFYDVKANITR